MKTTEITETLESLGFSLEILSGPVASLENDWQSIAYNVRLLYKGREIVETTFKLGIGHVKLDSTGARFNENQSGMFESWKRKPCANFVDKALQLEVAVILAKAQNLKPSLPDVMHSLLSDGDAYFSGEAFESWAESLGYDPDSSQAESIWKACDAIGRKLAKLPKETLESVRNILQDY